jgi:hypothetical protein
MGTRHGAHGIRKYCRQQSVAVAWLPRRREIYMFPYRARSTRLITWLVRLIYGRGKRT